MRAPSRVLSPATLVPMSVLAIDAGTTGLTALIVTADGTVASRGYQEFRQYYPEPGWVEHLPESIWQATLAACGEALGLAGAAQPGQALAAAGVTCVGVTNQRETAVLWDRATLAAPRRAIVWQDRRTADICARLRDQGHEPRVNALTGLRLDPYFTATKLTWLAENDPASWAGVLDGSLAAGTVDSYLIARLTGGRRHVTDASNASRTLLFDIEAGQWSAELCDLFGVPPHALPEVVPSSGVAGHTDPDAFLGLSLPVAGIAGDQQAAMFGQACFTPGDMKCTYGTGSFVLSATGGSIVRSAAGLLSTVAWMDSAGTLAYALEGSVFVTGAAVQWRRGVRPRADRAGRARLGSGSPRGGVRPDQGNDAGAPGPRHAGGNRVRGQGCGRCHGRGNSAGPRADGPRRRADGPRRRADGPRRRADGPRRRGGGPRRRGDRPRRRADGPRRRGDRPRRRGDRPRRRGDGPGPGAQGRWRSERQRPAHAAAGRSAAGTRRTAGRRGDHRTGRGLPGRSRHRGLVISGGTGCYLEA